jgi:hypothetical protein
MDRDMSNQEKTPDLVVAMELPFMREQHYKFGGPKLGPGRCSDKVEGGKLGDY